MVQVDGLLGTDALQFFKEFYAVPCRGGRAFKIGSAVVPYGNVDSFPSSDQLSEKYNLSFEIFPKKILNLV